jgi:hypothetical protein
MSEHALLIPPVGIMQVLHTDDGFSLEGTLRATYKVPDGVPFVVVHFTCGDGEAHLGFFPRLPTNNRKAQDALRILSDAHMVLTGPVILTGVPQPQLGQVVATLSVEDY